MDRFILLVVVGFLASPAFGADLIPAPEPQPPARSQPPAEQPKPEPPATDPGMVKQPETIPDSNSVVNPPVVDPKMAINPEAAPRKSVDPSQRPSQDQPPKKP